MSGRLTRLGILVTHLFAHSAIPLDRVTGIILSSVVPPLTRTMEEMAERYFGHTPLTVDPGTNTGMPVLYTPASDVGADRVVNGVAAYEAYGRATHIAGHRRRLRHRDYLRRDFRPQASTSAASSARASAFRPMRSFQRAARLPRVDVRKPPTVIGGTTVTSMQSGLFFGYVSMVDGIVRAHAHRA